PPRSRRRLQRGADFTGGPLGSFREVFLRHGLPGALLGAFCLLHPGMRALLVEATVQAVTTPLPYLLVGSLILVGLSAYSRYSCDGWSCRQFGWVLYLGVLSLWEEWVFRLAIPYSLKEQGAELIVGIILCNILFGAIHYFTLRWKWQWCVAACLGGFAFSRQMDVHFDLLIVAGIHWVATCVNTPRPPGLRRDLSSF
ncbi:MAG: hypothetical protein ACI9W1_003192, partial [Candidatus Azotimanducaceae bacterium]